VEETRRVTVESCWGLMREILDLENPNQTVKEKRKEHN
jgi:hypothetical protein